MKCGNWVVRLVWAGLLMVQAAVGAMVAATPAGAEGHELVLGAVGRPPTTLAAYYTAVPAQLFWPEEGVNVTIEGIPSANAGAEALNAGLIDITLGASEALFGIHKAAPELNALSIFTLINKFHYRISVLEESPIKTLTELPAYKVGVRGLDDSAAKLLRGLLTMEGGDAGQLNLVPIGEGAEAAHALQTKRVDAIAFGDGLTAQIQSVSPPLRSVPSPLLESGKLGFMGAVIVTRDTLNQKREALVRFGRGLAKAIVFSKTNPEAAVRLHWKLFPGSQPRGIPEDEALRAGIATLVARLDNVEPVEGLYGNATDEQFNNYNKLLVLAGTSDKPVPVDAIYTRDLLAEINDFDVEAIRKMAREWKP